VRPDGGERVVRTGERVQRTGNRVLRVGMLRLGDACGRSLLLLKAVVRR
jgi:hypothetical protein